MSPKKTPSETKQTATGGDKISSGLPPSDKPRSHYDIYAILEAPQELYFGSEKEVNVNIVEKVRVWTPEGEREKCYISPTKRRGVERRCLLWSAADKVMLMDKLHCGIPSTCCKETCPICRVFGGLITGEKKKVKATAASKESDSAEDLFSEDTNSSEDTSDTQEETGDDKSKGKDKGRRTFIGRLTHSGGVSVSAQIAQEKQRAMHPAFLCKEKGQEPMPYRKEYAQPGLLYPVSNHCLSIDEDEFSTVAYAFLLSLNRLGAGNPKGVSLARAVWNEKEQPLLVVDNYRVPMAERPIISPAITENDKAIARFMDLAGKVHPQAQGKFQRVIGTEALHMLQKCAEHFGELYLK